MKYTDEELLRKDPIEVYKLVLSGEIKQFPHRFFIDDVFINYEVAVAITRYFIEEKLNLNEEEILTKLKSETFRSNKLTGMYERVYNNSLFMAVDSVYPGRFKPWEFKKSPQRYWNLDTAKEAIIWLIEEKLKLTDEEILELVDKKFFYQNNLGGMLLTVFNDCPVEAIEAVYPGRFKPWEFKKVPRNFWNKENSKHATRWLIEEKLKWDEERILKELTFDVFVKYGLSGMLVRGYKGSPFLAVNDAYPGKYRKEGSKIVAV